VDHIPIPKEKNFLPPNIILILINLFGPTLLNNFFSSKYIPPTYQNSEANAPMDLSEAPVLTSECNPKVFFPLQF
jgi:hypothetical protein